MSVASLAGYINNGGSGGGSDFKTITIGEAGTDVELSCVEDNELSVSNIVTYTVELVNEDNSSETVILKCSDDTVLSVPNLDITGKGITFPDNSIQITAYTGGGGGGGVDSITAGDGISISPSNGTGDVTITSTVNPTDYLSVTDAASTYQPLDTMNEYVTADLAGATFQTLEDMKDYSTTEQANSLYQPIGNSFITTGTIASVKSGCEIAPGDSNGFIRSAKVTLSNFTGNANSRYFITINEVQDIPLSGTCIFDSTSGNDTIVNCSFYYNSTTDYDGQLYLFSFSVLGMN